MKTFQALILCMAASLLAACGTSVLNGKTPQEAGFRPPPGQTSQGGPGIPQTINVEPKDAQTVPPLPGYAPESETGGASDSNVINLDSESKPKKEEATSDKTTQKPKLPTYFGKMQTGVIGPSGAGKQAGTSFPEKEKLKVKFTFDKADIAEVTNQIFDDFLKVSYVLDPTLQGRISFYLEGEFTKEELFEMIFKAYEANGVSVSARNGIYYIQPIGAKTINDTYPIANALTLQTQQGTRPVIVIYRLSYMDVKQAVNTVKSFLTPGRLITSDILTNSVIFVEDNENARSIVELLKALDVNVLKEVNMEIVSVQNMSPQDAAQGMETLVGKLDIFKQSGLKGNLAFVPLPAYRGVLILAQNADVLKTAKSWLQALDVHSADAGEQIHVYFVQNGLATDISTIIDQLLGLPGGAAKPSQQVVKSTGGSAFGGGFGSSSGGIGGGTGTSTGGFGGIGSSFGSTGATGSSGLGSSTMNAAFGGSSTGGTTTGGGTGTTGRTGYFGGTTQQGVGATGPGHLLTGQPVIIADEVNNALVVRANATDWAKIQKTIETLDIAPRAVLIEVLVAEVDLTKDMSYGLQWFFNNVTMDFLGKAGKFTGGQGAITPPAASTATSFGASGLNLYWQSFDTSITTMLTMLADKTTVNILSHPTLLATDNKEAAIHVGGRQPIPTGSVTGSVTAGSNIYSTIEYTETGLILTVTPHINAGGVVRMEVEQNIINVDNPSVTVGQDNTAPSFTERDIKTTVLTKNDSTVVIGGMIQQNRTDSKTGIPYLQNAPILGPLFGSKSNNDEKQEVIIAITPHVVTNLHDTGATAEFVDALKKLRRRVERGVEE